MWWTLKHEEWKTNVYKVINNTNILWQQIQNHKTTIFGKADGKTLIPWHIKQTHKKTLDLSLKSIPDTPKFEVYGASVPAEKNSLSKQRKVKWWSYLWGNHFFTYGEKSFAKTHISQILAKAKSCFLGHIVYAFLFFQTIFLKNNSVSQPLPPKIAIGYFRGVSKYWRRHIHHTESKFFKVLLIIKITTNNYLF